MQNLITFNDIPQLMVDVLAKLKELDEKMDRLAPSVKADEHSFPQERKEYSLQQSRD